MSKLREGAPAPSGCPPTPGCPLPSPRVLHSPEELRPWLLAGLVLPKAAPRRWLHPKKTVARGGRTEGEPPPKSLGSGGGRGR